MNPLFAQLADGWRNANIRFVDRVRELRPEQLDLQAAPNYWPIWAIIGHQAGTRVYWLCDVLKEPGADTTPFTNTATEGWEDHLETPRSADELILALESTWRLVETWLGRWTPETLQKTFPREGTPQWHTYQYVFMRMVMHDGYHAGEVSLILGMHGLEAVEPWSGLQLTAPSTPGRSA